MAGGPALQLAGVEPLRARGEVGAVIAQERRELRRRQEGATEKGEQEAGTADANWRGKGLAPPSLAIYRSGGATLPKPRASHTLIAGGGVWH
jgi:hypothetical protein